METMTAMLDSLRPADSARSAETTQHRRPTSKDILAGGYNCQREIPEPVECEFCGRKLYHEALVMGRTVLMFAPFPQRCTCDRCGDRCDEDEINLSSFGICLFCVLWHAYDICTKSI